MPILRGSLKHTVRISRGLPPLQIYNTRIIWRRKGRIWYPKDIYRLRRRAKRHRLVVSYNVDKFYRRLSILKKHSKRLRMWRWPFSRVDRTYWYAQHVWKLKRWAASYRVPIYFRRFFWKLRIWKYIRTRFRRLRKLRELIRSKDNQLYVKYLTAPEANENSIKQSISDIGTKQRSAVKKNVYRRSEFLRLLNSRVYKPFKIKKAVKHRDWLKQYNSVLRKKRRYVKTNIISRLDIAKNSGFFGKFVFRFSNNWSRMIRLVMAISATYKNRIGFLPFANSNIVGSKYKYKSRLTKNKLNNAFVEQRSTNLYSKMRNTFFDASIKKTSNDNAQYRIGARYDCFRADDAFSKLTFDNPVFFNNLYYFCTKVRSCILLSVLWFTESNVSLFNMLTQNHYLGVRLNLFFFRNVYLSELSSGARSYIRRNSTLLPLLLNEPRTTTHTFAKHNNNINVLLFIIKYMYIEFINSFIATLHKRVNARIWISHTFFASLLCCYGINVTALFANVLKKNSICIALSDFLTVYINKQPTRLLLLLRSVNNSLFFIFWVLRLYTSIHNELLLRSLMLRMFILLLSQDSSRISEILVFILLRLSSISIMLRSMYVRSNIDKYYAVTSFICNYNVDNFRIFNAGVSLWLYIFMVGTDRHQMRELLFRYGIKLFIHQIEYTLFSYTKVQYLFFARYYYMTIPPLNSARLLCNYVIIKIATGSRIKEAFDGVYTWQTYWTEKLSNNHDVGMRDALYPVKGIRIVCSGPPYKARRTTSVRYLSWVSDEYLTGKMPLSTVNINVDYVQSHVVLRRSTIGIKVWLLLEEEVSLVM